MVYIPAELDAVVAVVPGKVVGHFVTLLGAVHKRKWLASEEGEAGNVDRHIASARSAGEVVEQSAAGVFIPQLVDFVVGNHPSVLGGDGEIAIGLLRSAR